MNNLIPQEVIEQRIFIIRGMKVMLSTHLAELYNVEPRSLIQAVRRNSLRFPADFMFQITTEEFQNLKSHFVISSWGGRRVPPYAFTEQGVAMLSSVLRSERAVLMNIAIMRVFVRLRELLSTHKELAHKLEELERRITTHDQEIEAIFDAVRRLMKPPPAKPKKPMGFSVEEPKAKYHTRRKRT